MQAEVFDKNKKELKELISETFSGVTKVLGRLFMGNRNFKYFSIVFDWIQNATK